MARPRKLNYTKALVICHGRSELQITRYISSNLHLPVQPYAKDKGRHSLQITGLINELNTSLFSDIDTFAEAFTVETSGKGKKKKLVNFKLFIVMDTDDCSDTQKNEYISKKMFSKHWLNEYIVTIYNTEKLEDVLYSVGIIPKIITSEKGTYYESIFPINRDKLTPGTVDEIKEFKRKLDNSENTNLPDMIEYFLSLI